MNTNELKRFAQQARIKLIDQITAKLDQVLNTESAELIEKTEELKNLREAINKEGREQIIDKVAYTWFNRLVALRFMDANDFQPLGIRVVSPLDGETLPELLQQVRRGIIPDELPVNKQKINDLLLNRITSDHPQEEVYRMLLVGSCNHLHQIFPFLFERIHDYSELLLPDDLLSQHSILEDIRQGMSVEDCQEVEILGWLYQFYISELNAELIGSKKKYKKEDLAPASQLFTPKWIVQYMVDNTLGQVWSEINPNSKVMETLEFYIQPDYKDLLESREKKNIEEIKFFEPCVGSGHILAYAFDVFYKIYEEEGYNPSDIPELIITKNLFGVDIDERAAQIASFVLLMKGRQKYRRFLSKVERENIQPNISFYQDFDFDEKFKNAKSIGSLIQVEQSEVENFKIEEGSLFEEQQRQLFKLYQLLGQRYDVVVTNPPYISSSRMEDTLKQYVFEKYPITKTDLFATFILRNLELTNEDGLTGYMTPFVWMFISSYEGLRKEIIQKHFINNLIQLEYSGFDGATVPICTFTLRNSQIENGKGSYIRLSDFKGSENQAPKTLEAIQNPNCGWFYIKNQKDFEKIPGNNIGYWLSEKMINIFDLPKLGEMEHVKKGADTGNNNLYLKLFHEISFEKLNETWVPYNKGGSFRRWYGNYEYLIFWENNGEKLKNSKANLRSKALYFKNSLTWSALTAGKFNARFSNKETIFDSSGSSIFLNENKNSFNTYLGVLNNKISQIILQTINPTLNYGAGSVSVLPVGIINEPYKIDLLVETNINISKQEWNSRETSWDFLQNELIRLNREENLSSLEEAFQSYKNYWSKQFKQLHQNEEELNKEFISIYGLEEELTPDVPLKDITILKDELKKKKLENLSDEYNSGWTLVNGNWTLENQNPYPVLPFDKKEIMRQFVSYAVGCMFGRYSLDKEGLVLANQGETLSDYFKKVELSKDEVQFTPDDDAIIPVLDDDWFEDDIVSQFRNFLRASFGRENFEQNLRFVEECLGRNIRDYFLRDFYDDHIKRYQRRPIYWQFSSASGSFNVLVYMHRYNKDTLNLIYNNYLMDYKAKLNNAIKHQQLLQTNGTAREQTLAIKEEARISKVLVELSEYEKDLYKIIQSGGVNIDLDDGVLVNYNKFGDIIKMVRGLNDKKAKEKVRKFDWIDVEEIR